MNEVLLRLLPHCPTPVQIEERVASDTYVAEVCSCPGEYVAGPVHWLLQDGRQMYCLHGPRHPVLHTTAGQAMLTPIGGGIACEACASGLYSHHRHSRLGTPSRCCYCGNTAQRGSGWQLKKHPALGVPGARR